MKNPKETTLTIGDVVETHRSYQNHKQLKHHILDLGIIVEFTGTGFLILQDLGGNHSLIKPTEVRKLTKKEFDDLDKE